MIRSLACGLVAAAAIASGAPAIAASGSADIVTDACKTLGLKPGELQFADCVTSLTQSRADSAASQIFTAAIRVCADQGLKRGTPAFDNCLLGRKEPM